MALDKLVDGAQLDSDLGDIADAIRAKGGTSAELEFPTGFVSAVQAIPTGTTPTGTKQISITANGTTTEDVTNYASAEITVNVQGGGTVNDMALIGSGTFTKTGTATSMTIPVTFSGTPRFACVIADSIISGSAQVVSQAAYYTKANDPQNVRTTAPTGAVYYIAEKAAGGTAVGGLDPSVHMKLTSSSLVVSRATATYVLQPNSYHWYIYGEAST